MIIGMHVIWRERAEQALEEAISEVRSGVDAIASVSLAMACLRADAGELPADEEEQLADHFELGHPSRLCPPDLLLRGGFKSGCPEHD